MARKILLADDSVTAQNMGRKILTEAGYEVITVNNGSAALKKIAELKPDIIVLDVYMPGYGGLEVCHRLKENHETARIPVLLTVGKLEPFKVEEARRVRADMHIIKPFEASELLTALTKLEDRIVAQSDIPKKGRFAKSGADAPPTEDFGDEQSGWKSRLIAPRKKAKAEKSEPKPEKKPEPVRDLAPESEEDFVTVNPSDWRSLLSASVAEDEKPRKKAASPESEDTRVAKSTDPATPEIKAQESAPEAEREPEPVAAEKIEEKVEVAREEQPVATPSAVVAAKQTEEKSVEDKSERDQDVADALASLIPMQGRSAEPFASREAAHAAGREMVASSNYQVERSSGPRWIAQATLVSEEESATLLEQEMERAYAQFAGSDANMVSFAMGPLDALSFSSSAQDQGEDKKEPPREATQTVNSVEQAAEVAAEIPTPEIVEPEPQKELITPQTALVDQESVEQEPTPTPETRIAEPVEATSVETASVEVKSETKFEENIPETPRGNSSGALWLSAPKAYVEATSGEARELEIQKSKPQEIEQAKVEVPGAETKTAPAETAQPQAAFAAAAGAEAVLSSSVSSSPAPESVQAGSKIEAAQPESFKKESELAAAWQSWRQIREVDAKSAHTAAPETEKAAPFKDAANWRDEIASEAPEAEGEEISSLVDTMLAELKPKLMKEIAKKMGKESKR